MYAYTMHQLDHDDIYLCCDFFMYLHGSLHVEKLIKLKRYDRINNVIRFARTVKKLLFG